MAFPPQNVSRFRGSMKLEDLQKVYDSLLECKPSEEDLSWGPLYNLAMKRREDALDILMNVIKENQDRTK